jgi:uncharacterized membrane protein HdeD (DUF308 family)
MNEYTNAHIAQLTDRWWMLMIRGAAAILFGVLTFVAPGISLVALVIVWGIYALVDGAFNLMTALRGARTGRRWGWLMFEGIVSIAAGILTFLWPGITALALLAVIAVWAMLTGIAEIAAAVRLRKHIQGEWLLALTGVLSIVFGALLLLSPGTGALALLWMIGTYAIVFGLLLGALGLRLHSWGRAAGRPLPSDGAPAQV